jgi:hypothetical protein
MAAAWNIYYTFDLMTTNPGGTRTRVRAGQSRNRGLIAGNDHLVSSP